MSGSAGSGGGELLDRLTALRDAGATPDLDALAREHGASEEQARALWKGLQALDAFASASFEVFDDDVDGPSLDAILGAMPSGYSDFRPLGSGGMGVVFRARHEALGRDVALKVIRPEHRLRGQAARRFHLEARTVARLRHPNIVTVHDIGEVDGQTYFTMDLIEGHSLAELLREGPLSAARSLRILGQVAAAVAHMHAHGVIHRDLKPANILLDADENAFVTDFGLASGFAQDTRLTGTGAILGTPAYMSPEQARGDNALVGEATDIHALGVILHECLTGSPPFLRGNAAATVHAVIHDEFRIAHAWVSEVPTALAVIVRKSLEKEPRHRYGTAQAFAEDLERFLAGRPIEARAPTLERRLWRLLLRHRLTLLLLGLVGIVAAIIFSSEVAPRLRRSEGDREFLLAEAQRLVLEGKGVEAFPFYERILAAGAPTFETRLGWLLAARDRLRSLNEAGLGEEAEALATRANCELGRAADQAGEVRFRFKSEVYRSEVGWGLRIEAGIAAALLGRSDVALAAFKSHHPGFAYPHSPARSQELRIGDSELTVGAPPGPYAVLDRLEPALLAPEHPIHDVAQRFYAWALKEMMASSRVAWAWTPERGANAAALCPTWLPVLAQELWTSYGTSSSFILHGKRRREWHHEAIDAAVCLAERDDAEPAQRFAAASLLAVNCTSPIQTRAVGLEHLAEQGERARRLLAAWRELYDGEAAPSRLAWVRWAIDAVEKGDLPESDLRGWLREETAFDPRPGDSPWSDDPDGVLAAWRRWLLEIGPQDRRRWFMHGLGLQGDPEQLDPIDLVDRLEGSDAGDARGLHELLLDHCPAGREPPLWRRWERRPGRLHEHWRRILTAPVPPDRCRLRAACFEARNGVWSEEPLEEQLLELEHDAVASLSWSLESEPVWWIDVGAGLPGAPAVAEGHLRMVDTLTVRSTSDGYARQIAFEELDRRMTGPWSHFTLGLRNYGVSMLGDVAAFEFGLGPLDGSGRDRFIFVVGEPVTAPPTPWRLSDWRRQIVNRLEALEAWVRQDHSRGHADHDLEGRLIKGYGILASWLPVPEAVPVLQRLGTAMRDDLRDSRVVSDIAPALVGARLRAGDTSVLDLDDVVRQVQLGFSLGGCNPDMIAAAFWQRILRDCGDEATEGVAREALDRLDVVFSDDFVEGLGPPGFVLSRPPPSSSLPFQTGPSIRAVWDESRATERAALLLPLLGVVALLAALVALASPRNPRRRAWAGLVMAVTGAALACVRVAMGPHDLAPAWFGLAAFASGMLLVASGGRGRLRFTPGLAAAAAVLLAAMSALAIASEALAVASAAAFSLALVSSGLLPAALREDLAPPRWLLDLPRSHLFLVLVPLVALWLPLPDAVSVAMGYLLLVGCSLLVWNLARAVRGRSLKGRRAVG